MSVAVIEFGAEWLLGGNVLYNVLIAYWGFLYMYQINYIRFISKVEGFYV